MANEQPEIPAITDQRVAPPGIFPKNTQALLMGGVALVMVIIIIFSGHTSPKPRPSSAPGAEPIVQQPSADKLNDYKKRIEEESQKLKLEQAQLDQVKKAFPVATNPSTTPPVAGGPGVNPYTAPSGTIQSSPEPRQKSWIEQEREKREYLSLFETSIALSYRKQPKQENAEPSASTSGALPGIDPRLYSLPFVSPPPAPPSSPSAETAKPTGTAGENAKPDELPKHGPKASDTELNHSEGKGYRLFEGTIIETVLSNRLDGTYSGPVNCLVSYDVYSHDHRHVLIPSGSRILGDVHQVDNTGQQRLAVSFHRLIMPDGYSVNLDQFHGLDQVGETGLRDQVNHHYIQMFGASIAIGMIAGLAQSNTQYGTTASATDVYRQGVANSLSQSSMHILDRFLNILPTFTIREGQRIKIYLAEDLTIPAYENHQMPSDL